MRQIRFASSTIAVVDPSTRDYGHLVEAARRYSASICFLATAAEALRVARRRTVALWVVNVVLPDLSGLDLCSMLKSLSSRCAVYMVTARYRAEDERIARIRGASLFASKPICVSWFEEWWAIRFPLADVSMWKTPEPSNMQGHPNLNDRYLHHVERTGGRRMKQT